MSYDYMPDEKRYKDELKGVESADQSFGSKFFYVYAQQQGKWVQCWHESSYEEATAWALAHVNQYQWEVFPSNSRNSHKVQQEFKAKVLDVHADLARATQRMGLPKKEQNNY